MNIMNVIAQIKNAKTRADIMSILQKELYSLSDREELRKAVMEACKESAAQPGAKTFRLAVVNLILNAPRNLRLVHVDRISDMDDRFVACSLIPFAGLWVNGSESVEKLKDFATLEEREEFIARINRQAISEHIEIDTVVSDTMLSEFRNWYLDEAMYYLRIEYEDRADFPFMADVDQDDPDWFFDDFAFGFLWNAGSEQLNRLTLLHTFEERAEYVRAINKKVYEACGGHCMPERERIYANEIRRFREHGDLSAFKVLFQHDAELRLLYAF